VSFTEEEGARYPPFTGSLGFIGAIHPETAKQFIDRDSIKFEQAMIQAGLDARNLRPIHKNPRSEINSYVELHIEQGPILESEKIDVGIVTSIIGLGNLSITIHGRPGHAGTTPMSPRRDALLGAAEIIIGTNRIARRSPGTAATVGKITVSPNASNVIPATVELTVDVRARTTRKLHLQREKIMTLSNQIAKDHSLGISIVKNKVIEPRPMSESIIRTISAACESLELRLKRMPSGAGHDCQNMARITSTGMIFVPSHNGISHAPTESTAIRDLENGANVLLNTVLRLTSKTSSVFEAS
jgi:hydantoinase/carbamoylase family amidase